MTIETRDTATEWYGPEGAPAVVLLHDWMGRLPWITSFGERLAAEGFRVAIPDLFDGRTTKDDDEAAALLQERVADMEGAFRIVADTLGEARAGGSERAALVGFSMGSAVALGYAGQGSVDAVVAYYGSSRSDGVVPRMPVLFQLAETDDWDDKESPEEFQQRLREEGHDTVTLTYYEGAVHGFQNEQIAKRYDADASAKAWRSTLAFLREHLGAAD